MSRKSLRAGFTLVEAVIAMGVLAFMFLALYAGLQTNFSIVRLCRENQTATQILTEKFETIRLYNWSQVHSNGYIRSPFIVNLEPRNPNTPPFFTGTVQVARAPFGNEYSNEISIVTVRLDWVSGKRLAARSMSTLVARHGLHNYVNR
jgi:type II secretory pathway pseudopilin PulG